jgi:pilus assembly protein CpaF
MMDFLEVCNAIEHEMTAAWDGEGFEQGSAIELQKKAMIGYREEVGLIQNRIGKVLAEKGLSPTVPVWYEGPEQGIFHELWGWAGMAEWFSPAWQESSSAKVIGERIYYLSEGEMRLMPQRINDDRREQLIRALLLLSPEERLDKAFHEIYMLDGTRVTIFRRGMTKGGQDVIIFRRYIIPTYSFEEQAARGTIPAAAIPLFRHMVQTGYNVVFTGSVRSAKTTFLSTWQRYEDPALEGVMVETDPEIPLHHLMPDAPVVQLLADGTALQGIAKHLLRSDADYFILAEARDGIALDTAVRIARKGTKRMKMTFHTREPRDFAEDAAVEIVRSLGGDQRETALRVADSFDYLFHFVNLRRQNQKKLKSIHEIGLRHDGTDGNGQGRIYTDEICRYDFASDSWRWVYRIGEEKKRYGEEEDPESFRRFSDCLSELAGADGLLTRDSSAWEGLGELT